MTFGFYPQVNFAACAGGDSYECNNGKQHLNDSQNSTTVSNTIVRKRKLVSVPALTVYHSSTVTVLLSRVCS